MAPTPNSALLAAHLREDTADLLALLPAARRAAAGGPGGGEATLDGIARAAYRTLRTAENPPFSFVANGDVPVSA